MTLKTIGLSIAALSAGSSALLVQAATVPGLRVDITSPAVHGTVPWNTQAPYAVTATHDGKSTKYGELPANAVVLRVSYVADTTKPATAAAIDAGVVQISQSNCMGCHDFAANSAGPSFAAIAKRYAGHGGAAATLASRILGGSHGAWGSGVMPPHPDLSPAQATAIAQWIIVHGNDSAVQYSVGKSGSFRMVAPSKPGPRAGVILSAFYTGPLKPGEARTAVGRDTVIVSGS